MKGCYKFVKENLCSVFLSKGMFPNLMINNTHMSTQLRYQAVLISFLIPFLLNAQQQPATIDSLKKALGKASTPAEKVYWFDNLSRTLMNVNPAAGDSVGKELILFAEQSRDRELMFKAYMSNGLRCSYFRGQKAYNARSIEFYEKALAFIL